MNEEQDRNIMKKRYVVRNIIIWNSVYKSLYGNMVEEKDEY